MGLFLLRIVNCNGLKIGWNKTVNCDCHQKVNAIYTRKDVGTMTRIGLWL